MPRWRAAHTVVPAEGVRRGKHGERRCAGGEGHVQRLRERSGGTVGHAQACGSCCGSPGQAREHQTQKRAGCNLVRGWCWSAVRCSGQNSRISFARLATSLLLPLIAQPVHLGRARGAWTGAVYMSQRIFEQAS